MCDLILLLAPTVAYTDYSRLRLIGILVSLITGLTVFFIFLALSVKFKKTENDDTHASGQSGIKGEEGNSSVTEDAAETEKETAMPNSGTNVESVKTALDRADVVPEGETVLAAQEKEKESLQECVSKESEREVSDENAENSSPLVSPTKGDFVADTAQVEPNAGEIVEPAADCEAQPEKEAETVFELQEPQDVTNAGLCEALPADSSEAWAENQPVATDGAEEKNAGGSIVSKREETENFSLSGDSEGDYPVAAKKLTTAADAAGDRSAAAETEKSVERAPKFIESILSELNQEDRRAFEYYLIDAAEPLKTKVKHPLGAYSREKEFLKDFFASYVKYKKLLGVRAFECLYERYCRTVRDDSVRTKLNGKMINVLYFYRKANPENTEKCKAICKKDIKLNFEKIDTRDCRLPSLKRLILIEAGEKNFDAAINLCERAIERGLIDKNDEGFESRREKLMEKREKLKIKSEKAAEKIFGEKIKN